MLKSHKGIFISYISIIIILVLAATLITYPKYRLTQSDRRYLSSFDYLVAVGDGAYPPFGFMESGQVQGYEKDLMYAISEKLGIEIRYQPMLWTEVQETVLKGDAHIVTGMRITQDRKSDYSFTNPYLYTYFSIVSRDMINSVGDLSGKKVVVQEGSNTISVLQGIEVAEITKVPSPSDAMEMLDNEEVDAWIENHQVANFHINRRDVINYSPLSPAGAFYVLIPYEGNVIDEADEDSQMDVGDRTLTGDTNTNADAYRYNIMPITNTKGDYAIAVNKDYSRLTKIIDKAILQLQADETLDKLDIKWFGLLMSRNTANTRILLMILGLIFVFASLGCLLLTYNESLRINVKEKTKELEDRNQKLTNFSLKTAHAFGAAIESKDIYTGGHSKRVGEISYNIGNEIGLGKDELFQLYLGALIHDVGKVGIPDDILQKPGKLTDSEFEMIKRHPQIGESILSHLEGYELIREIALYHHERFDGKTEGAFAGYPGYRSGEDIPLAARIVCIADAYDAMTSDRPYRKALSKEEAKSRLLADAAKQFDPHLVDAFFKVLERDENI